MSVLSKIEFGSFFVYSPSGSTDVSKRSKRICHAVKQDQNMNVGTPPRTVRAIPFLVEYIRDHLAGTRLERFFDSKPILVPAPRSSPTRADSLRPTDIICKSMIQNGLGSEMKNLIERIKAVPKAAFSKAADRPTVQQHFGSLASAKEMELVSSILVVDDVITSGSMLLASVSRLKVTYPNAEIKAFSLIRTMSGVEIEQFIDPCHGTITLRGERSSRTP